MSFLSSPYMSSFVGFESLFDEIERMSSVKQSPYPAYDIKKLSNNSFLIVLALAGFSASDLIIEATSSELVVYGKGDKNGQHEYIHKGIAKRAFTKNFRLADPILNEDLFLLAENEVKKIELEDQTLGKYMELLKLYDRADILNDIV